MFGIAVKKLLGMSASSLKVLRFEFHSTSGSSFLLEYTLGSNR